MDNLTAKKILNADKLNTPLTQPLDEKNISVAANGGRILLFINWFKEKNIERMNEYIKCLKNNISNIYIDKIFVISEQGIYPNYDEKIVTLEVKKRPTFNNLFEIANKHSELEDYIIISNTDIYFDNSIRLIKSRMRRDDSYALTRWDVVSDDVINFHNRKDSQDVWIFKGLIRFDNQIGNYSPGIAGCDNKLAYELKEIGYNLTNPSLSIKAFHLHNTNVRNYIQGTKVERVQKPYLLLSPSFFEQRQIKNKVLLHIGLNTRFQKSLETALRSVGDYYQFDWQKFYTQHNDSGIVMRQILALCDEIKPDYIFTQIQTSDILTFQLVKRIIDLLPSVKILNWNGDIRLQTPQWMLEIAKFENVHTAFTNYRDINYMKEYRYENVHHIQIGFEESVFSYNGERMSAPPDIFFTGNNYGNKFPLTNLRLEVIKRGKQKYKNKFLAYGQGWNEVGGGVIISKEKTAAMYRSSKIGVSINNINAFRYSSDRLFNIMASGCFALVHYYDGLELDFENKKHIVWWKSVDELFELIDYYLAHADERKLIAAEGCKKVWGEFRWKHRVEYIKQHIFN